MKRFTIPFHCFVCFLTVSMKAKCSPTTTSSAILDCILSITIVPVIYVFILFDFKEVQ